MKPVRVVSLDTHILVWAIKGEAEAGQEQMISRAKAFLQRLDEEGVHVLIPAVVVAELLVRVPEERHADVMQEVSRRFMIVPFDAAAAQECARLHSRWIVVRENQKRAQPQRDTVKADLMILATAIVRGVTCLYTHDEALAKLAAAVDAHVRVVEMPVVAAQIPLDLWRPEADSD